MGLNNICFWTKFSLFHSCFYSVSDVKKADLKASISLHYMKDFLKIYDTHKLQFHAH